MAAAVARVLLCLSLGLISHCAEIGVSAVEPLCHAAEGCDISEEQSSLLQAYTSSGHLSKAFEGDYELGPVSSLGNTFAMVCIWSREGQACHLSFSRSNEHRHSAGQESWVLEPFTGDGKHYLIKNGKSGIYLGVLRDPLDGSYKLEPPADLPGGAPKFVSPGSAQIWIVENEGDWYTIQDMNSGKYLGIGRKFVDSKDYYYAMLDSNDYRSLWTLDASLFTTTTTTTPTGFS